MNVLNFILYLILTSLLAINFLCAKEITNFYNKKIDTFLLKTTFTKKKERIFINLVKWISVIVSIIMFINIDKANMFMITILGIYGLFIANIVFIIAEKWTYMFILNFLMLIVGKTMFNLTNPVFYMYLAYILIVSLVLLWSCRQEKEIVFRNEVLNLEKTDYILNSDFSKRKKEKILRKRKSEFGKGIFQIVDTFHYMLIIGIIGNFYFFQVNVPTGSMLPEIPLNSRIITNMIRYKLFDIERDDVVTFKEPLNNSVLFTKRVKGMAGDVLQIRGDTLYNADNEKIGLNYAPLGIMSTEKIYVPKKGDKLKVSKILVIHRKIENGEIYTDYDNKLGKNTTIEPALFRIAVENKNNFSQLFRENEKDKNKKKIGPLYSFTMTANGKDEMVLPILSLVGTSDFIKLINGNEITLKEDYYLMLGDNSANSFDSRYFGYVAKSRIKGKLELMIFPKLKIIE